MCGESHEQAGPCLSSSHGSDRASSAVAMYSKRILRRSGSSAEVYPRIRTRDDVQRFSDEPEGRATMGLVPNQRAWRS